MLQACEGAGQLSADDAALYFCAFFTAKSSLARRYELRALQAYLARGRAAQAAQAVRLVVAGAGGQGSGGDGTA